MLGHPRLPSGDTYPEITEMQAKAIISAACELGDGEDQSGPGNHDPVGRQRERA